MKATHVPDITIHEAFEEQVEKTPLSIALECPVSNEKLSFKEVNERANQLANYLTHRGVKKGDIIAVSCQRSVQLIVILLGILKSGSSYLPVDPNLPEKRVEYLLQDSSAKFLIHKEIIATGEWKNGEFISLSDVGVTKKISSCGKENIGLKISADDTAYVLYTSGSTGQPKGIRGHHRGMINRFMWMWNAFPFKEWEVCCQKTVLSFVDAIWEIFGPILRGVKLVVIPPKTLLDISKFVDYLSTYKVTRLVCVPSLLNVILEVEELAKKIPKLQIWSVSGEALSYKTVKKFREVLPNVQLLNIYGSTEVAADCLFYDVKNWTKDTNPPIGKPISNTFAYILNEKMEKVSPGEVGEIYIGGMCVCHGYINKPKLTTESFVKDPFDKTRLLYKMNDYGKLLDDGITIMYVGRSNQRVKIRGIRIELGEIENTIMRYPAIEKCVVIVKGEEENKQLIGILEPKADTVISKNFNTNKQNNVLEVELKDNVHRHLEQRLPHYMIPSKFIVLNEFPATFSGKIDRVKLKKIGEERKEREIKNLPQTEVEKDVLQIVANLIHEDCDLIDMDDEFGELGVNSLTLIALQRELSKKFKLNLQITDVLGVNTVKGVSNLIDEIRKGTHKSPLVHHVIEFLENSNFVDDSDKNQKIKYRLMDEKDQDECASVLSSSFVDPVRGEPITVRCNLGYEENKVWLKPYVKFSAEQGLSVVAVDESSGEIVGCLLTYLHGTPDPPTFHDEIVDLKFAPIGAILEAIDHKIPEELFEGEKVLHEFLLGVISGTSSRVAHMLTLLVGELAFSKGFTLSFTESTGNLSQTLDKAFNYNSCEPVSYDDFEYEGEKVFKNLSNGGRKLESIAVTYRKLRSIIPKSKDDHHKK